MKVPIVMAQSADPVADGQVASLARPGGNITGLSSMARELGEKRIQLLKEVFPKLSHTVAVMWNPAQFGMRARFNEANSVAPKRLPAIYESVEFADAGGLMAYGPDVLAQYRRAAAYVDKIFKGAKPGELPIEQPTRFELAINMKTAKALGIKIPQSILLQATRVIE